ncbi:MAG: archease [Acidithiobacillus sp.]|uniref:Archease n=1 Tax=Acidithiobacillus ferruginosus TaxID=3063951 RepID=A0ACD5IFV9_9PROT|nr:archease [Acidithiobacillus ferruginosus]MBU2815380.1 archease [Acidithiobacillus ferruginosus]
MAVFSYVDHDADIGVIGRGRTLEESFEGLAQVRATRSVRIDFEEEDLELALVTSLNTLLVEAGIRGLVLGRFRLVRDNSHWQGEAWGEPWRERTWVGGRTGWSSCVPRSAPRGEQSPPEQKNIPANCCFWGNG